MPLEGILAALEKTNNLVRIAHLPLNLMVKNEANPNKMSKRDFDLLCDNFNTTGWTDPALVRPINLKQMQKLVEKHGTKNMDALVQAMIDQDMKVRIVGGHHRYEAGAFLGFLDGPVTVIMDPNFDDDAETFQMVRMNMIKGRLDPQAFMNLYTKLSKEYSDEIMQDAFGFAEEAEFKRLIQQTAKTLPDPVMQQKFKEGAKEIKTIEGLSKLLNHLFNTYGDTLPYGFMVFDYNNQRSMWLRVDNSTMKALDLVGDICIAKKRTIDDIVGTIIRMVATGDSPEFIDALVAETPEVILPGALQTAPTKENLAKLEEVAA